MASDHPPDPPDPPQPSSSDQFSLPKESISQSSIPDLVISDLDYVAVVSSPANPALPGVAVFSSGGLPSVVVRSPSSSKDLPLLPLPVPELKSSEFPALVSGSVEVNQASLGGSSVVFPVSNSWAGKVQAPIQRVTFPVYNDLGVPRVRIPSAIFMEGAARHREFVALTFLDKTPSIGKIHAFLSYLWGKGKKIEVFSNSSGTIVARIKSDELKQRILEAQLWHIDGDTFIVQEWSHKFSYSKPNLEAVPIWVKLSNVPCDLITEVGLFHIGGALGHPIDVRNLNGFSSGEVQVRIDLSKPLPKLIELETDDGDVITVEASYLRLPRVCSHCRIVGHRESACETINHSPSDKVQENSNISVSPEESQVDTNGPLIAEPQKVTSTSEVIIAFTETYVLEKSATKSLQEDVHVNSDATTNESLQEADLVSSETTTNESLQEAVPDNSDTTAIEKVAEEIVPFPDRVSAPYAVQFETPVKTSISPPMAKEFESSPSSSPLEGTDTMENNSPVCDDTLTPQPFSGTEVKTVAKPNVFGDLFDENGVFIGEEWNSSPLKSRGGRPLKPSQKMRDSDWPRKRGRRDRGDHG
ncbi:hypothetical protein HA466_0070390 [Hirschfeldia incana]|nr:hypothetical protein HA466_0070390 [Hirschfeldia incana]